jgi:hypothetical protein
MLTLCSRTFLIRLNPKHIVLRSTLKEVLLKYFEVVLTISTSEVL